MGNEIRVKISSPPDIVMARQHGRNMAAELGFSGSDLTIVATAVSELARNIVEYAKSGEITLKTLNGNSKRGIIIIALDEGQAIHDVDRALQDGYTTGNGPGLAGNKRLMGEFEISSEVGKGTTITLKKWTKPN
jgi:serine/threonine-protein kinase RsbT